MIIGEILFPDAEYDDASDRVASCWRALLGPEFTEELIQQAHKDKHLAHERIPYSSKRIKRNGTTSN